MARRLVGWLFLGICAFCGGAISSLHSRMLPTLAIAQSGPAGISNDLTSLSDQFERIVRKVSPAVVYVEASKAGRISGKGAQVEESGSGVLIRIEGYTNVFVVTNNHVIQQARPDQITINLADGRLYHPGKVWTDPETDIAILRIEGPNNLPTAGLGDSDAARVGQWVLAIGSPFGLNQTVTHGIISARDRGQVSLGSTIRIKDFLQTDAAINPGSSGGPLVNLQGEVIGINTAIASNNGSSSGVAFSIPANLVKRVAKQLLERGNVSRGYLGMQLMPAFEPADAFRLGLARAQGAWVEAVYQGTPAFEAGLRVNDVVLEVDQEPIRNENHLINLISTKTPGQRIQLQVWRDRKSIKLEAIVGDWARGQSQLRGAGGK